MSLKQRLKLLVLYTLLPELASSAWLENIPQTIRQPDGQTVQCFVTGDEYNCWLHDQHHYTIVRDPATGFYVYAATKEGELAPTRHIVGRVDPAAVGLTPGAMIAASKMLERRRAVLAEAAESVTEQAHAASRTGVINNIVVFIRFSDEEEFVDSASAYDSRFNAASGNSLKNYFWECSYNALTITSTFYPLPAGATVVSYQDVYPRAYYMPYDALSNPTGYQSSDRWSRERSLLNSALMCIAPEVPVSLALDNNDDGYVDNVVFIVSGYQSIQGGLLWPHMSHLSSSVPLNGKPVRDYNLLPQSRADVGMLCHEMFHTLGAPDLYNYRGGAMPVGWWDVMGINSSVPQHTAAYIKMKYLKWIASIPEITSQGLYSLHSLVSPTNNSYCIASPYSTTEHFVLEYRKQEGTFESGLTGEGLLVYRINTNLSGNASGPPDEVYIYRPDGTPTEGVGQPQWAGFSSDWGRTAINDTTNPYSFLSDGSPGGLDISEVGAIGPTISFKVSFINPPSISAISPSMTGVGEKAFALDVYGTNFYPTSVVRLNGTERLTSYVSATQLQADILVQDLANAGSYPVTVFTPGRGLSNADTLTVVSFPGEVVLLEPGHDAVIGADSIRLVWSKAYPEVIAYRLDVATDSGFASAETDSAVTDTSKIVRSLLSGQQYFWRVRAKNLIGWGNPSEVREFRALFVHVANANELPTHFQLMQNYPNPFNPSTTIHYALPHRSHVSLTVFNTLGQQVAMLVSGDIDAGYHSVQFDGSGLASGVYFYRFRADSYVETRKLLLIR